MKNPSRGLEKPTRPRAAATPKPASSPGSKRSLQSIVGAGTYRVWVEMIAALVPGGRTHRMAPLIGGMLQYAATAAYRKFGQAPPEGSAAASLLAAEENGDPQFAAEEISDLVERLFRDSKVGLGRATRRGEVYSVVEAAVAEFVRWDSMPWE